MIADNRIAEKAGMIRCSPPNWPLRDEDVDLALLGFDEDDLDRLLAGTGEEN
jgi:hypothetical protein